MKIIMDSCSIILLAKASMLSILVQAYPIVTTQEVYVEVLKGKEKLFPDALLLEKIKQDGNIKIITSHDTLVEKIKKDYAMGAGEASVIASALSEKEMVIVTDNMQGRKVAKIFALPFVGSIEIVVQLYMKKHISKEKAYEALHTLKEGGWFYDFLIEKAMEDIK